ncbi:hypothetical protein TR2A62_1989 [Thalassobium sp. R2A62]|nr:hypothetical protein TR2A62_1989 [Thalassobium sp. R2A62]
MPIFRGLCGVGRVSVITTCLVLSEKSDNCCCVR